MFCKKCGKDVTVTLRKDNRGVVDAYCSECDTHIKKMSSAELLDEIDGLTAIINSLMQPAPQTAVKPPCKYCGERFYYQYGRLGNIYRPLLDAKFCPMCGRELTGHERDY